MRIKNFFFSLPLFLLSRKFTSDMKIFCLLDVFQPVDDKKKEEASEKGTDVIEN